MAATSSKEQTLWQRFSSVFSLPPAAPAEVPLSTDKLSCKLTPGTFTEASYKPVVLVSCGSFNPPTVMHLRMFELAKDNLTKAGYDVLGGYMSPVNDAYNKPSLVASEHRIAMCQAAAESSSLVMVDPWEAGQSSYQRSLHVLQRIGTFLRQSFDDPQMSQHEQAAKVPLQTMLLCGSDLVESFMKPGVWKAEHLRSILDEHGVVCISRHASTLQSLTQQESSILREHAQGLIFVQEPVNNDISASKLREQLGQGNSVKYLTPDAVIEYIKQHNLYRA